MRKLCFFASLLCAFVASPSLAQFAEENADEYGVLNPADFSWRHYLEQMDRFPERIGIICYNAYLLDKTGESAAALKFFKECARRGNPPSMIALATLYETGHGTRRDLREAARWLRRAAETGYAPGQYHYGVALLLGQGVPRDVASGKAWIAKAAAQNDASALRLMRSGFDPALLDSQAIPAASHPDQTTSDLSYESWIDSRHRLKCLYGYAANKTGDHASAIRIFEDCIARWDDVYSMISLAQIHENGVGVPRNLAYATELLRRGAETDDEAGYSSLARYHYGVALAEGKGVEADAATGLRWLQRAAAEGVEDAARYIAQHYSSATE